MSDQPEAAAPHTHEKREHWSGQTAFILAAIGSAVGLGNIWRFPGEAYDNGGGAFMIPYVVALLTAGIPILFLENAIGHRFRGSSPLAMRRVHRRAEGVGWFHVAICFVIGLYYTAVIAWALSYFFFSFTLAYKDDPAGFFTGEYLQLGEAGTVSLSFVPHVLIPLAAIWIITIVVLALGLHNGVERLNVIGIPLLVVTFGILVVRALTLPGAADGIDALFTPDFSALTDPNVWIAAYGQIFFSLSLAYGVMLTYASYRRRRSNITSPGLVIAFGNSSFEVLAGIGVFATVGFLAHQQDVPVAELDGLAGPILSFVTFPAVIAQMPGGPLFGALFFGSLVVAGLTSLISVMQTISAALQDKFGLHPRGSAVAVGVVSAVLSVIGFGTTTGLYLLDVVDQWSNQLGIVAGAIAMIAAALWFGGRSRELQRHLSAVSTLKLGTWWLVLVNAVSVLLIYMFATKAVSLARDGYEGYPTSYLAIFGWGTAAFLLAAALVMPWLRWRRDIVHFRPWPTRQQLGLPPGRDDAPVERSTP
ncbi:sodium-dependent transporter [Demequina lignilytica]|uniref:Sodium-dependent transporter n=1 Tax=Demequina lignilytica TaxID=3051663 RepID=A0AB35MJD1_9MICO|nr:sodium-dependent transporter [Demequina sp. SYSU T0a273]MDN4483912.1 sodium-dependent transporter [Demequina sp. SYSU T0a273]